MWGLEGGVLLFLREIANQYRSRREAAAAGSAALWREEGGGYPARLLRRAVCPGKRAFYKFTSLSVHHRPFVVSRCVYTFRGEKKTLGDAREIQRETKIAART